MFSKQGFVSQTTGVHVSPGQHLVLDVVLERAVRIVTINGGQVLNIFGPTDPEWAVGVTLKIKNITPIGTLTG